ncbi:MAG TPA: helix-turn-helix domain-containing protein [Solirubrobacteraceae bacterium]
MAEHLSSRSDLEQRPRPRSVRESLRRLHDEMIREILGGDGLEGVARLAATAIGAPVMIIVPELIGTVVGPASTPRELDGIDLAGLESWVTERASGRPAAVRDEIVAETPIALAGRAAGVVGLIGDAQPGVDACWVLDVAAAASVTAVAIEDARLETEHALRGSFLERLRGGEQLSRAEIVRRAARLGCDLSRGALALCIEVDTNRPRLVTAAILDEYPGAFAEPFESTQPGAPPRVWALLPARADSDEQDQHEAAKRLAGRLRQYGAVGLSRLYCEPTELARAIDEAELMLEVLCKVAGPSGDQIVDGTYKLLFRLLASHPDELDRYHQATIAPLVVHDDQYRTDLVRTLEAYLGTNCNMNVTAETIFAHRHTVAHRLDRIRELTGLDATVHEDRERLGLGLKIHRLTV